MNTLYKKAISAYASGQTAKTVKYLEQLIRTVDASVEAHKILGICYFDQMQYAQAAHMFAMASKLDLNDAEIFFNHAVCLTKLKDYEHAINSFAQCIILAPTHLNAHIGLADAYKELNRLEPAIAAYVQAINLCGFDDKKLLYKLSLALLTQGYWQAGFELFENRTLLDAVHREHLQLKRWNGEHLQGKHILVECEQGFGDSIQFSRYLQLLHRSDCRITMACPDPLIELFQHSFPFLEIKRIGTQVDRNAFDYYIPMMSLAGLYQTRVENVPLAHGYLQIPMTYQRKWEPLANQDTLNVGLAWSGNPQHTNDKNRSIKIEQMLKFLPSNVQYFLIQKDDPKHPTCSQKNIISLSHDIENFADTAAICAHMDLVICVDTSLAHLCGALGIPTWVMLPFSPDWRWLLERKQSVWYNSLELIRQPRIGDWESVLGQVKTKLSVMMSSKCR